MPAYCYALSIMINQYREVIYSENTPFWSKNLGLPVASLPAHKALSVTLGPITAGTRLLPCLTGPELPGYQFVLRAPDRPNFYLPPVGDFKTTDSGSKNAWASHKIDWILFNEDVAEVHLEAKTTAPVNKHTVLLHCSTRTTDRPISPPSANLKSKTILAVPCISQMSLPDKIKKQACSPISTLMVLAWYGITPDIETFVHQAQHQPSKLYGVWPSNMLAASQFGIRATARYFDNLDSIVSLLDLNMPVPVSICYQKGDLSGAAIPQTQGHVVVITGIRHGEVYVNDPAAPTAATVARRYNIDAFNQAWQRHHCIGYLLDAAN